jgi:glucokinase
MSEGVHVGLDLGATKVYGALVDGAGAVSEETYLEHGGGGGWVARDLDHARADLSAEERALGPVYATLADAGAQLVARARASGRRPLGVGVGAPGMTRPDGVVLVAGGLAWRQVPLGALLERRLGLPVRVENDVNLTALGEQAHGAGRGRGSMFVLSLGTGVGGAVVIDGRLWRGHTFAAGELGALVPGPEYVGWDNTEIGALETHGAGAGMTLEARRLAAAAGLVIPDGEDRGERLFASAAAGAVWAKPVIDRAVDLWTVALSAVQSILDPEVIVLSGGVAHSAAAHLPEIQRRLQRALPAVAEIVTSALGYRAAILGVPSLFAETGSVSNTRR